MMALPGMRQVLTALFLSVSIRVHKGRTPDMYTLGGSARYAQEMGLLGETPPDWPRLGVPEIDSATHGFAPGTVGVVGAHTSVGKSSLALWCMMNSDCPQGIISLEDSPSILGQKAVCAEAGLSFRKLLDGVPSHLQQQVEDTIEKLDADGRHLPLVEWGLGYDVEKIGHAIERLAKAGCKMIWIDYLQKIRQPAEADRRTAINGAWAVIQQSAVKHHVCIAAISQLGRNASKRDPDIHALKESGDLENEARWIVMLWQDEGDVLCCSLRKNVWGGTGATGIFRRDNQGNLRHSSEVDAFGDWRRDGTE